MKFNFLQIFEPNRLDSNGWRTHGTYVNFHGTQKNKITFLDAISSEKTTTTYLYM